MPQPTPQSPLLSGLLAGLMGSFCCLGPSVAALLGMGAASSLAGLQLERPLALALGLLILVVGILRAWRRVGCTMSWRLGGLLSGLLAFALSYGMLAYGLPALAARQAAPAVAAETLPARGAPAVRRLTLSLSKLDCPPCVANAAALLAREPGVTAYLLTPGSDLALIDYDPAQTSPDQVAARFPTLYHAAIVADAPFP